MKCHLSLNQNDGETNIGVMKMKNQVCVNYTYNVDTFKFLYSQQKEGNSVWCYVNIQQHDK